MAHSCELNASFALQYILSPARYTSRIPNGVSDELAGPIMCAGSTIYRALKSSGVRAGQWIVIPGGGGGVGHVGLAFGRAMGIRMIAIDTGAAKKELCIRMGAEAFIDFKEHPNMLQKVLDITGIGAHAVIVTGGSAAAYKGAEDFLRIGGTLVCLGLPPAGTAIAGADPVKIVFKKLHIKGSLVGDMNDVEEALDIVARGAVRFEVTAFPFEELPKALSLLVSGNMAGRAVVRF